MAVQRVVAVRSQRVWSSGLFGPEVGFEIRLELEVGAPGVQEWAYQCCNGEFAGLVKALHEW